MTQPDLPDATAPSGLAPDEPTPFSVVLRFAVAATASGSERAGEAVQRDRLAGVLADLSGRPGFLGGWVGRAVDAVGDGSTDQWLLVLHWRSVGEYRRALSSVEVRMAVVPVLSEALDEPTAFEVLHGHLEDSATGAPWGAQGPSTSARAPT